MPPLFRVHSAFAIAGRLSVISTVVLAALCSQARAQFEHLTSRIPEDANAIVLIDVAKLHRSPLAERAGKTDADSKAFQSGLWMLPPGANRVAAAAKFDFATMRPQWELAVMDLDYELSIPELAARLRGTADKIEGKEVAVLPGDVYVVKLGAQQAAVGSPARRQDVARWIKRFSSRTSGGLSGYLQEAQGFADRGATVIMAIDLEGAVSTLHIREKLERFAPPAQPLAIDVGAASEALASIRGLSVGVTLGDQRVGAVKVDFVNDISAIKEIAKPLLLRALAANGAMIDEFEGWDARVDANSVHLQGVLGESGMGRIMSVLEMPSILQEYSQEPPQGEAARRSQAIASTQLYLRSVESLIDDLRRRKEDRQTLGQLTVWFNSYARKINSLPRYNVDADALQYGEFVADTLREGGNDVTAAAARSRVRQREVPDQYDIYTYANPIGVVRGRWWGVPRVYGWYGWQAVPNASRTNRLKSQVRTQEQIRGSYAANLALEHIEEATASIRDTMLQKYSADF